MVYIKKEMPSIEWLYEHYYTKKLSINVISKMLNVERKYITNLMKSFGFVLRSNSESQKVLKKHEIKYDESFYTKEWLYQKYYVEKLCMLEIAKIIGCTRNHIKTRMEKYNFPIRTAKEHQKLYPLNSYHGKEKNNHWVGRKHKQSSKNKISEANSNFDKHFIQKNGYTKSIGRKIFPQEKYQKLLDVLEET